jgi:Raf kinase inhibitor-like YbhB/YbcL family protein
VIAHAAQQTVDRSAPPLLSIARQEAVVMRTFIPVMIAAAASVMPSYGIAKDKDKEKKPELALSSTEFKNGEALPKSATCDSDGKSPALAWKGTKDAKGFALIVDDPDAPKGPYVHWVLFDIPKDTLKIPHGGSVGLAGTNSADEARFAPACPPKGSGIHHYNFHLYAVDTDKLGAKAGASRGDVEKALKGHVIGESTLTGTYERR